MLDNNKTEVRNLDLSLCFVTINIAPLGLRLFNFYGNKR
jgi:hypothetical protein